MESANIYKDLEYKDDAPAITVLYKSSATKEVRIAFKAAQTMAEHQTPYPISVMLVEGKLNFGVEGTVHHLTKGDILFLEGGIPHDLTAVEDSIVRLSLSTQDSVDRVKSVAANS